MIEERIHFDYEDGDVKLNFSFPTENKEKSIDQMKRFSVFLGKAKEDLDAKIEQGI